MLISLLLKFIDVCVLEKIYSSLQKAKIIVLFDDRNLSIHMKTKDSGLTIIFHKLVMNRRNKCTIEIKKRNEEKSALLDLTMQLN